MTNVAVEIGAHSVRAAARVRNGISIIVLGESSEQFKLPSVYAKESNGTIHVGFDAELWKYHAEFYPIVEIEEREKLYTEVLTVLFRHIIRKAKEQVKDNIDNIAVVVPAYYGMNDPRKENIKKALDNLGIINSCVSAHQALCSAQASVGNNEYVFVYDMGYSGVNISLLQRRNNSFEMLKTKKIDGVGGQVFDGLIYGDILEKCDPSEVDDLQYRALLNDQLEKISSYAKERLSSFEQYYCPIPFSSKPYLITRNEFVEKMAPLLGICHAACNNMVSEANVDASKITQALLWGGSCKIPFVSERCIMKFMQINPSMKITKCTEVNGSSMLACRGGLISAQV